MYVCMYVFSTKVQILLLATNTVSCFPRSDRLIVTNPQVELTIIYLTLSSNGIPEKEQLI